MVFYNLCSVLLLAASAIALEPGATQSTEVGTLHRVSDSSGNAAVGDSRKLLDQAIENALVEKHNEYRGIVGTDCTGQNPTAAYMPPLSWNAELASFAQAHVDTCTWAHTTNAQRSNLAGFSYVGENLYMSYGGSRLPSITENGVVGSVSSWYSEESDYTYSTRACSGVCGHYTQIVWAATTEVGCAAKVCAQVTDPDNGNVFSNAIVVSCNYGRGGNSGGWPYVAGYVGALCPDKSQLRDNLCYASPPLVDAPGMLGEDKCGLMPTSTTPTPTSSPTATPTSSPVASPVDTNSPTSSPTATPTSSPVVSPVDTNSPTKTPISSPTATPTSSPVVSPVDMNSPTKTPTSSPTATPTSSPVVSPVDTNSPTKTPTSSPTATPTSSPVVSPVDTNSPTKTPTSSPTATPTSSPVAYPVDTNSPTESPTSMPTVSPIENTCNDLQRRPCWRQRATVERFGLTKEWPICRWVWRDKECVQMIHPCNHLSKRRCIRKRRYMRLYGRRRRWRICAWHGESVGCRPRF